MTGGGGEVDGNGQGPLPDGQSGKWPVVPNRAPRGKKASAPEPKPLRLSVAGIEIPSNLVRCILHGLDGLGEADEEARIAAALGYVVHIVERLSFYLDIPLRFPLTPSMSRSVLHDPAPLVVPEESAGEMGSGLIARGFNALASALTQPWDLSGAPRGRTGSRGSRTWTAAAGGEAGGPDLTLDLDLFSDSGWSSNCSRYALAVHLLSKNIEQLVMAHAGLAPAGANQILQNLFVLMNAAQAALVQGKK